MTFVVTSSAAAPKSASRRAGAAYRGGVIAVAAAPALAAAPPANRNGSETRASCQTGTDVFAISAPVYVDRGRPSRAAAGLAIAAAPPNSPVSAFAAANPVVAPLPERIHEPTLIGEVTLN